MAFESSKFNADKDRALPWFFQQKDRLTALYPDMSEFMIHRNILRQCGGDLEHAVRSRTTEQSSAEDIINILEEVTTRTRMGSNIIRKCHNFQSTTHSSNSCPRKGKINEIDIEKEPDVEKDGEVIEENSDDKSSIFSESSRDIENINATFDIMESYSPLPQLIHGQLDLSKIQDAQLMKTKPNRVKGYTAGNSCITEVVIEKNPTKLSLDPGAFFSCVGKYFLKTCVPKIEDQLLQIDGIKLNSAKIQLYALLYDRKEAFASEKEPLGAIFGYEVVIILNIKRTYPPLLKRPAYTESPKSREALEIHIKELLDLGVIRKVGHNEEVEITTAVIVAWHNGKSRMVEEFRALNTYTVPDRYPIPKIQISLTQVSQAVYISTMDALKGFHQNVVTPRARK
ncbi:hypothetical protein O181_028306 [Austropuccinia psidii MF-1]|uniref:Uncharacterized protein n=1 Tax=Austropuccinia psidii MF-1 TaxID=1389203 RepID=A0A9Q3H291_9BASI|nr:hypothetical protein [Austropuccinia psidii MF-1]